MRNFFYTCCNDPIQFILWLFNPSTSWRRFLLTILKQICLWTTLFIISFRTIIPEITNLGLKINILRSINVFIKYIKVFLMRICVLTMLIQLWSEGHSNCPTSQEAGAANAGLTSQFFASVISFEKTMLSIAAYPSLESPRNARKII